MRTAATPLTLGPSVIAAPPLTWNGGGSRQTPRGTPSGKTPRAQGGAGAGGSTYAPAWLRRPPRRPPHMPSSVLEAVGSTIAIAPSQRSSSVSLRHSRSGAGLPGPMLGGSHGATAEEPAAAKLRQMLLTPSLPM